MRKKRSYPLASVLLRILTCTNANIRQTEPICTLFAQILFNSPTLLPACPNLTQFTFPKRSTKRIEAFL